MSENTVNVKSKGLFIPEPIALVLYQMKPSEIGKVVALMARKVCGDSVYRYEVEKMERSTRFVLEIWKSLLERDPEEGNDAGA